MLTNHHRHQAFLRVGELTHLAQVIQQFLGAILRWLEFEQCWMLIDEICVQYAVQEFLVLQHVQQERDVRFNATNAEFS